MKESYSESYKASGVDIESGYKAVELIKKHIAKTITNGVLGDIGGFGALFKLDLSETKNPVLVGATDGVGTKLKLAFLLDKHDTIGIDVVAMCVNDLITTGAKPLFFLDYLAQSKVIPEKIEQIVKGVCEGCLQSDCSLIGGETAEMPGFYQENEYDIAGFSTGVVDKEKIINNENIKIGDAIIALPSSGIHSNGFSLVRKVFDVENADLNKFYPELNQTIGEALLTPTKIYVKPILALLKEVDVHSIAHITGGGFYENIPRALKENSRAKITKETIKIPAIFNLIAQKGNISERDMFNTFNMGIGMIVIVNNEDKEKTIEILNANGEDAYLIGEIIEGEKGVEIC